MIEFDICIFRLKNLSIKLKNRKKISDLMIEQEMERSQSYEEIWTQMGQNLDVMDAAVKRSQEGAGVFLLLG